ncbi:S8 family serine peptidase [Limibacter armeniacum]|uniref:S8 family serine peptidase n=1 Tax=Limibacter armeniacum TaxID=466084 RepID=UPI002FE66DE0
MKKLLQLKLCMLFMAVLCAITTVKAQHYEKQVFRVKFEKSSEHQLTQMKTRLNAHGHIETGLSNVDLLTQKHGVVKMKRVFPYAGKFEAKHQKHGLHLWYEVEIEGGADVLSAKNEFYALSEISTSELVYKKSSRIYEEIMPSGNMTKTLSLPDGVNDPNYVDQWHYENNGQTGGKVDADIDLDNAWLLETGSMDVIVSIHDEGVDFDHEDLAGNMWINTAEIPNNGIDDDNNGFIDDIYGYNFAEGKGAITPGNHGTHVAGTVAAESNNGIGGSGVAGGTGADDGVRMMSCQVFTGSGSRGFAASYVYAADNGSVISQNSWGYTVPGSYEQSVMDAIDYFIAEAGYDEAGNQVGPMAGGIVIFAAGNDADNDEYYPGYDDKVIAVAGTNHTDYKFYASNYGDWVDIAAPGENIFSSTVNDGYSGKYSGTSMACPHVSGVAALIVSKFKDQGLTPDHVRSRLVNTTDPLSFEGSEYWGTGRVNAYKALADNDGVGPAAITDLAISEISDQSAMFTWTAPGDLPNESQVTTYELRYSTQPIDADNFGDATLFVTEKPSRPGQVRQ